MRFDLSIDSERLNRQLDAFRHDIRAYQKHARTLGSFVQKDARKNIREQKTFQGRSFVPRKVKRKKKAMLKGLARTMAVISKAQEGGVVVSWRNPLQAGIAGRHQWGVGEDWSANLMRRTRGCPDYKAPCTQRQARALNKEGYRQPRKGKAPKKLSVKALQATFTLGQAALMLRLMRTGRAQGKQHWKDTVPERPFLGVTPDQAARYCEELAARILRTTQQGNT